MELCKYIDHTLLSATATKEQIRSLCETAVQYKFHAVCVPGSFLKLGNELLQGSNVQLCTVVGFPFGFEATKVKLYQTKYALKKGATEIDMVMNQGWFKAKNYDKLIAEIAAIKELVGDHTLKVIIETANLTPEEVRLAARCVSQGHADYVKTSTGYAASGATVGDVEILQDEVGGHLGIKASGGIRSRSQALELIAAGASRIGTSNGVALLSD